MHSDTLWSKRLLHSCLVHRYPFFTFPIFIILATTALIAYCRTPLKAIYSCGIRKRKLVEKEESIATPRLLNWLFMFFLKKVINMLAHLLKYPGQRE